jgi:hypothetical protein
VCATVDAALQTEVALHCACGCRYRQATPYSWLFLRSLKRNKESAPRVAYQAEHVVVRMRGQCNTHRYLQSRFRELPRALSASDPPRGIDHWAGDTMSRPRAVAWPTGALAPGARAELRLTHAH